MKNNGSLFHYKDNIFFGRRRDDSVRILQLPKQSSPEWIGGWPVGADDDLERTSHPPIVDITIPADSWASIVASVSEGGEGDYRFFAAKAFHDSEGEIEITPKGKPAPITETMTAAAPVEGTWQPIASAPKDGTPILATGCNGFDDIVYAWWVERSDEDGFDHSGWHGISRLYYIQTLATPTHWMPLPAPPVAAKEAE